MSWGVRLVLFCLLLVGLQLRALALFQHPATQDAPCGEEEHEVRIGELSVVGTHTVPEEELRRLQENLRGRVHCVRAGHFIERPASELLQRVQFVWQQHGYFKAVVWPVRMEWRRNDTSVALNATFRVEEGRQYTLSEIKWSGAEAFADGELSGLFPLFPGAVFNVQAIRAGFEALRELYSERGHISATFLPKTEVDDSAATVLLTIEVTEGPRFAFGRLEVFGVDAEVRQAMLNGWARYRGGVFSHSGFREFLRGFEGGLPGDASRHLRFRQDSGLAEAHVCLDYRTVPDPPCFSGLPEGERETLRRQD